MNPVDPNRLFLANWTTSPSTTVSWASVVEKADDQHEKRRSLVSRPYLSGKVLFSGIQNKNLDGPSILRLSKELSKSRVSLPLYHDFVKVQSTAGIGATVLSVSITTYLRFFVGQKVAVCRKEASSKTQWNFEIKTIQALTASTITLTTGLSTETTVGSRIYPLVSCEVSSEQAATLVTDQAAEMEISWTQITDPLGLPALVVPGTLPPGFSTFNGYPIFDIPFDWNEIQAGHSRDLSITASGLGTSVTTYGDFVPAVFRSRISLFGRDQISRMMGFFDSRAGMTFPFWLPIPVHEFRLTGIGSNSLTFDMPLAKTGDMDSLIGTHVCIWYRNGTKAVVRLASRASSTYTTVQTLPDTVLANVRRVSACFLVRFSSDSMSYTFVSDDKAQTEISCVQLRTCQDAECVPTVPDISAASGGDLDAAWTPCECDPCVFDVTMSPYPCSSCDDGRVVVEAQRWTPPRLLIASFKDEFAPDLFHQCQTCLLKQWIWTSSSGWTFAGTPSAVSNRLKLTDHTFGSAGTAWFNTSLPIVDDDRFEVQFRFSVREIKRAGSEGFSAIFAHDSQLGVLGGRLGYHGITKSLAVEFDLRHDAEDGEVGTPHISVQTQGDSANTTDHSASLGSIAVPGLDDGKIHKVRINYSKGFLRVYVDHMTAPKLTIQTDFFQTVTTSPILGFGASNDADGSSRVDIRCAAASVAFRSFRKALNRLRGSWRLVYDSSEELTTRHWHHLRITDTPIFPNPPAWTAVSAERIVHRWIREKAYVDEDGISRVVKMEARIEEPAKNEGAITAVCMLYVFLEEMDEAWMDGGTSQGVTFSLDDPAVYGPSSGASSFRYKVGHPWLFHASCVPTTQEAPCATTWFPKNSRTDSDDPYTADAAYCFSRTAHLPWNIDPSSSLAFGISLFQHPDPQAGFDAGTIMLGGDCPTSELFEWLTIEDFPGVSGTVPSDAGWDSETGGIVWESSARILACNPSQISEFDCCDEIENLKCIKLSGTNDCCFNLESVWSVEVTQLCRFSSVTYDAGGNPIDAREGTSGTFKSTLKFYIAECNLLASDTDDKTLKSIRWEARLPDPDYVYRYWRGGLSGTMGDVADWNADRCNEYLSGDSVKLIGYSGPTPGFGLLYLDKFPYGLDSFKDGRVAATVKTSSIAQGLGLRCATNGSAQGYVCVVDPTTSSAEIRNYYLNGFTVEYTVLAHKYGVTISAGDRLEASVVGTRISFVGNGGASFSLAADDCTHAGGRFGVVALQGQTGATETVPTPWYEMLEVDDYGPDLITSYIDLQPGSGFNLFINEKMMPGYGDEACPACSGTCGSDGCSPPLVSCTSTGSYLLPESIFSSQFPRLSSSMEIPTGSAKPAPCTSLPGGVSTVVATASLINPTCDTSGDDPECFGFRVWLDECVAEA